MSCVCVSSHGGMNYSDASMAAMEAKTGVGNWAAQDPRWILWAGGLKWGLRTYTL